MAYVMAEPEYVGLGKVRTARQQRKGARRRKKKAEQLQRTTQGRLILAKLDAATSAGTASSKQARLIRDVRARAAAGTGPAPAPVAPTRFKPAPRPEVQRVIPSTARTPDQVRRQVINRPAPPDRRLGWKWEGNTWVYRPTLFAQPTQPRPSELAVEPRFDLTRRIAERSRRGGTQDFTPDVAVREFAPDFGPSRSPFSPDMLQPSLSEGAPEESGTKYVVPALLAAAAYFVL